MWGGTVWMLAMFLLWLNGCANGPEVNVHGKKDSAMASSAPSDRDSTVFHAKAKQARLAEGWSPLARFDCRFTDGGLPKRPVPAIPLDEHDLWFVLSLRVVRLVEGALPPGLGPELTFAVHSPALFFRRNGLVITRGTYYPSGTHLCTLWGSHDKARLDLEVEPSDDPGESQRRS